uniref:Mitochondrial import inner membrane translocase subunit TIM50 n=1 Tax=Brassica oleracea var. oleracea TaxID=109376 RepID=A0A0D3C4L9_BRAOL
MAEEKSKKSIVLADDSDDDEYASEKYSEQTELSSILDKLSLGPEKKKKKLLILSPNGLLLYRVHVQNLRRKPENRSPDATCGPNLVYKRPFAGEFMKFCLERFEVGIWSSANESNVDIILNIVLEDLKNKLLFVWDNTGVFPVTYDPTDKNDDFLDPEGEFCSYLDDLANATDVQAYIKENSFGQPKIDSSHPDWSFYCKVSKIVSFLA